MRCISFSIVVVSGHALLWDDAKAVSLDRDVDVAVGCRRGELVVVDLFVCVELIVPHLRVSFIVAGVRNGDRIEALTELERRDGSNEEAGLVGARIKAVRNLSDERISPFSVFWVPLV